MAEKPILDAHVMRLFDGYVHGQITRREFLDRAAAFTASGVTAAALLSSLSPNYALARQVDPDDKSIEVSYKKYASPKGAGVMQGYYVRPSVIHHKLPAVLVIHENRGLNPYIEDVARRLGVAGFIAFAPDALTPLGGYPGNDDDGRALQSAGRDFINYVYADVNHGFHNDTTPRYDKEAADLAWQRTVEFFSRQLELDS